MKHTVYIGWDSTEQLAYEVAQHSILNRTNYNEVPVIPLKLDDLKDIFKRPIIIKDGQKWCPISEAPVGSEFSNSRFCVPFLQSDGLAVFVDSDIVCLDDISNLFDLYDGRSAVQVVKHNYVPRETIHKVNMVQNVYNRKNWSSVMLFNCAHPAHDRLTLHDLNTWPGRDLHAFKWLEENEIGELPPSWNYLVDVIEKPDKVSLAHFTLGGPWLKGWEGKSSDYVWLMEKAKLDSELIALMQEPEGYVAQ